MSLRSWLISYSRGDGVDLFWRLFFRRARLKDGVRKSLLTFLTSRMACRRGGYVGPGAAIAGQPLLPHGLHGVYISRFAQIGTGCVIYQNVTIGEVDRAAPEIGDDCLIGAGAVLVGGIRVGNGVKIGAGAVVSQDVPDGCTVVAQPPRILERGAVT